MTRLPPAFALILGLSACTPGGGRLEVDWTGVDTARFAVPATAEWCEAGRYAAIRALSGDTGVVIVVFPSDTVLADSYAVADTLADSLRPVARVVLRWSDRESLRGFRSDSGIMVLRREQDGSLAGELSVTGRLVGGTRDSLALTGVFRALTVRPAPEDCPALMLDSALVDDSVLVDDSAGAGVDSLDGNDVLPEGLRPQRRGRGLSH